MLLVILVNIIKILKTHTIEQIASINCKNYNNAKINLTRGWIKNKNYKGSKNYLLTIGWKYIRELRGIFTNHFST